jgi:hypothetical protein
MNPDEDHQEHNNILEYSQEHNNILKYSQEHSNILKYISFAQNLSVSWWVPGHVAQDQWTLSNDYKGSRNSINRDQDLSITCTIVKQQEKQHEHCCEALAKKLIITKIPRSLFKCKSILFLLSFQR